MTLQLLHQGISETAASAPDRIALVDGARQVTYADLDARTNRVAALLAGLGVRPGDRVCFWLDKSVEAVVALYGILKAGAAYVPLDPSAPVVRVVGIAADCSPTALVSTRDKAAGWAEFAPHAPNLLVLDSTAADLAAVLDGAGLPAGLRVSSRDDVDAQHGGAFRPAVAPTLDDLAYILYTSGSTGVPKGVMLSHRNGAAFVSWAVEAVGVTADDHVSSLAPFHFDLSTFDLFAPALAGARVVLVPRTASVFPIELAKFVNREAITVWYSVPSMLALLAERGGLTPGALPTLREVLFAGEVFPTPHLHKIMTLLPHAEFWNLYGPTETNVCTAYRVPAPPAPDAPDIPIGSAIGGVDTIAVADNGTAVGDGEVGELFVAGPTVMQGYWGDAERTAQRLVSDPLGDGDTRPWYRTGDLVIEEPDGNYRFLGRRDNQVKSRGYRIELGDIETALHTHPAVRECAAVAIPDSMVTNTIQAWVVTTGEVTARDLATHLNARIPSYMVPEKFRFIDALPRTSTDKVDRKGLTDRAAAEP